MKITITPTTTHAEVSKLTTRIWEGTCTRGTRMHAFVLNIDCSGHDAPVELQSTVLTANHEGLAIRIWEGTTAQGRPVIAQIVALGCPGDDSPSTQETFKADMKQHQAPSEALAKVAATRGWDLAAVFQKAGYIPDFLLPDTMKSNPPTK